MKIHTTITLISFLIVATLATTSIAKNQTWGHHGYNDRLLLRMRVIKISNTRQVSTHDLHFPEKYTRNRYIITEIRIIDKSRKDGGYVQIRKGGPGYRYVSLHLKSQRNHGLHYIVMIYGRKEK